MKLWDIAHSRTGDKGNIANISLIAYDPKDYELLREKVTAEKVKEHFKGMVKGEVVRYELPNIHALNFVTVSYTHLDVYKRQEGKMPEKAVYSLTEAGESEFQRLMFEISSKPINIFLDFNAVIAVSYTHLDVYKRQGYVYPNNRWV